MEASMLATVSGRPLHYLVREMCFILNSDGCLTGPSRSIYRQKDGISNLRKNASSTSSPIRNWLRKGSGHIPGGQVYIGEKMRPIQRGTAPGLRYIAYLEKGAILNVIPVNQFYEPAIPGSDV
jgi:hypothetical protein